MSKIAATAAPMEGGGAYNRNSSFQAATNSPLIEVFVEAAESAPLDPADAPLIVADYGSSQGQNSLAPMSAAIAVLRRRAGPERAIWIAHNDQPSNDFVSLFQLLDASPQSYLAEDPNVFACAIGRSFFRQVLPAGSVALGWSTNSVHWLSRSPPAPGDAWALAQTRRREVLAAADQIAAEDWRNFLAFRARELRSGGRMVVTQLALGEQGPAALPTPVQNAPRVRDLMLAQGVITAEECARILAPMVYRTRAELANPFAKDGVYADLQLESLVVAPAPDPFWTEYEIARDAEVLGRKQATFARVAAGPSLASALAPDKRPRFLDAYEAILGKLLAEQPAPLGFYFARLVFSKK